MTKDKKQILVLFLIFFLALFLRLWQLDRLSPGFTPDEAAQGYTAYSILKTGRDEWGHFLPLNPRSFGDFKPPLQTYLMIPSIAFFGLNEFAVRLPNALLSSFSVIGIYLLSLSLFKNLPAGGGSLLSLFSALLLALSPWHLPLSRGAFEANLTVFFSSFGFYFLKKSLSDSSSSYDRLWAALFLGLNLFSYHSAKLITPFFVFIFYLFYRPLPFWSSLKKNTFFLLPFALFLFLAFSSFFSGGQKRGMDIAIFSPTDHWQALNDQRWWAQNNSSTFGSRLFNNKLTHTAEIFTRNYLSYFSTDFFFTQGAGEGTYGLSPGRGLLFIWELPLLLFGLYYLFKKEKKDKKTLFLILAFILLSPLPAALAKGDRSANRASSMMPWIQIFSAFSLFCFLKTINRLNLQKYYLLPLLFIFIFSLPFLEDYFIHSPRVIAKDMLYGRCEALSWAHLYQDQVDEIIVSRKLSEPQAYTTFCLKLDPRLVQSATPNWMRYEKENLSFVDQLGEYYLGPYHFKEISLPSDFKPGTLLIGLPSEFVTSPRKPDKIINYPYGNPALYFYYLPREKTL